MSNPSSVLFSAHVHFSFSGLLFNRCRGAKAGDGLGD